MHLGKGDNWVPNFFIPSHTPIVVVNMAKKTKRYEMRFVPYDAEGKRKKGCPFIGADRGHEDGDIVKLPLEKRWESWWELVDESSVPKAVLERDQKKRDAFMVEARIAEAERARQLARDERPATVV